MTTSVPLRLVVRRLIPASPERLFKAWTTPSELLVWWGPRGVRCTRAEVDPRVGGRYRIDNALVDGRVLVISGEFSRVDPPKELVYTWRVDPADAGFHDEIVTVQFLARGDETEVVVTHEHIPNARRRDEHQAGWDACLDGLVTLLR